MSTKLKTIGDAALRASLKPGVEYIHGVHRTITRLKFSKEDFDLHKSLLVINQSNYALLSGYRMWSIELGFVHFCPEKTTRIRTFLPLIYRTLKKRIDTDHESEINIPTHIILTDVQKEKTLAEGNPHFLNMLITHTIYFLSENQRALIFAKEMKENYKKIDEYLSEEKISN